MRNIQSIRPTWGWPADLQVEEGRDASLELADETAALRQRLDLMQLPSTPAPVRSASNWTGLALAEHSSFGISIHLPALIQ